MTVIAAKPLALHVRAAATAAGSSFSTLLPTSQIAKLMPAADQAAWTLFQLAKEVFASNKCAADACRRIITEAKQAAAAMADQAEA